MTRQGESHADQVGSTQRPEEGRLRRCRLPRFGRRTIGLVFEIFPEVKFTTNLTYNQGPFTAFLQGRYIDSGLLDANDIVGVHIVDNDVDSVFYTDLRLSYGRDLTSGSRWEVFGNIQNLFDEDPPVAASFSTFTATSGQVNSSLHDVLGRRYTLGFRYQL